MNVVATDPALDLVLERVVDVPPALVWKAWTTPEILTRWFTPAPWTTPACEMDLRPGGRFRTVMRSPEGEEFDNVGCFLEVVPGKRLTWTSALGPGFRPQSAQARDAAAGLLFTAVISIEPEGAGTRYTATVIHGDASARQKHAEMGFEKGWAAALTQLVAVVKTL